MSGPPGAQHAGSIDPDKIGSMSPDLASVRAAHGQRRVSDMRKRINHYRRPWRRWFWKPHVVVFSNVEEEPRPRGRGVFEGLSYTTVAGRWWLPWDRIAARHELAFVEREEAALLRQRRV